MDKQWIALGLLAVMVIIGWLLGKYGRIDKGGVNSPCPPDAVPPPPPPPQRRSKDTR